MNLYKSSQSQKGCYKCNRSGYNVCFPCRLSAFSYDSTTARV